MSVCDYEKAGCGQKIINTCLSGLKKGQNGLRIAQRLVRYSKGFLAAHWAFLRLFWPKKAMVRSEWSKLF